MRGTSRRTPILHGVRVTFPRPSMLDLLPSFWRSDPERARRMDHVLSLFEGELTEIDELVAALPYLFDPNTTLDGSQEWLASFVGMTFDERVSDATRRQLLREAVELFKRRGTLEGLERLCEILSGAPIRIVEGFRLRRRAMPILGAREEKGSTSAVLGEGFELGGSEFPRREDGLPARIARQSSDSDDVHDFFRRWAHRFTVVVLDSLEPERLTLLDDAVEAAKPAHTVHDFCTLDDGFRTGINTHVGLGTMLGPTETSDPAVLGDSPLGAESTLATKNSNQSLGTFVGGSHLDDNTTLG